MAVSVGAAGVCTEQLPDGVSLGEGSSPCVAARPVCGGLCLAVSLGQFRDVACGQPLQRIRDA